MNNLNISTQTINVLKSIIYALLLWMVLSFLVSISDQLPGLKRFFILLGGGLSGYIQFLTYIAFFFCILELNRKQKEIDHEYSAFANDILPIDDQLVLNRDEVADIKLSVIRMEKQGVNLITNSLIKKACAQFRNNNSISETLQVLESQVSNEKEEIESELSMVRYLITAMMSLGFIGTLIGLSAAIGNAHLAKTEEGMSILTGYLNFAFDTTLVALALGLIINYLYYKYIEDIDKFFAKSKSYIIDNLISRIYLR